MANEAEEKRLKQLHRTTALQLEAARRQVNSINDNARRKTIELQKIIVKQEVELNKQAEEIVKLKHSVGAGNPAVASSNCPHASAGSSHYSNPTLEALAGRVESTPGKFNDTANKAAELLIQLENVLQHILGEARYGELMINVERGTVPQWLSQYQAANPALANASLSFIRDKPIDGDSSSQDTANDNGKNGPREHADRSDMYEALCEAQTTLQRTLAETTRSLNETTEENIRLRKQLEEQAEQLRASSIAQEPALLFDAAQQARVAAMTQSTASLEARLQQSEAEHTAIVEQLRLHIKQLEREFEFAVAGKRALQQHCAEMMQRQVKLEDELNQRRSEDSASISPTVSPGSVSFGELHASHGTVLNRDQDNETRQHDNWGGLRSLDQLQVDYLSINT